MTAPAATSDAICPAHHKPMREACQTCAFWVGVNDHDEQGRLTGVKWNCGILHMLGMQHHVWQVTEAVRVEVEATRNHAAAQSKATAEATAALGNLLRPAAAAMVHAAEALKDVNRSRIAESGQPSLPLIEVKQ